MPPGRGASRALIGAVVALLLGTPAGAAELKQHTIQAFNRYLEATEKRMADHIHNGRFLVIDDLPKEERREAYAQLRNGMLHIQKMQTAAGGDSIDIPDGMVHDWAGIVFIPNATLEQVLQVLEDYPDYQNIYSPTIQRSKLLSHDGRNYKVYMRYYRKAIVTVTFDADFDVHYVLLGDGRAVIRSTSTRIAEVANPGEPDEHDMPVGNDHGYVWRFDNFWHIEQKDGGVYAQVEAVALSRSIPFIFRWLINPLVESIPRKLLADLLAATRMAVESAGKKSAAGHARGPQIPCLPPRPSRHLSRWGVGPPKPAFGASLFSLGTMSGPGRRRTIFGFGSGAETR